MKKYIFVGMLSVMSCITQASQQSAKVHPKKLLRRHSTAGSYGGSISSQEVSKVKTEQELKEQAQHLGEYTVEFEGSPGNTTVVPSRLINKMSEHCILRLHPEKTTIAPYYESAFALLLETFEDKDSKDALMQRFRREPLDRLVMLYNFCRLYKVSAHYLATILNTLLGEPCFLEQLVKNPESSIFKDMMPESVSFANDAEIKHAEKLTRDCLHKITGDSPYYEAEPFTPGSFLSIVPAPDDKHLAVVMDDGVRIYLQDSNKKWKELHSINRLGRVEQVVWNHDAKRFAVVFHNPIANELQAKIYALEGEQLAWLAPEISFGHFQSSPLIFWGKNFDRYMVIYGRYLWIYEKPDGEVHYERMHTIDLGNIEKVFCNDEGSQLAVWSEDQCLRLYAFERGAFQIVTPKEIASMMMRTKVFASPDGKGFLCAEQRMGNVSSVTILGCQGSSKTLPHDLLGEIDQVIWGKNRDYVALLVDKRTVHIYKCLGNLGYRKLGVIPYEYHEEQLIREIFGNEDMSKIIIWLSNTLLIYQRIMLPDGNLHYQKTEEITMKNRRNPIMGVFITRNADRIMVQRVNHKIKTYRTDTATPLPSNKILLLPAFQQCYANQSVDKLLHNYRHRMRELIEEYAGIYGDWVADLWLQPLDNRLDRCKRFTSLHKKNIMGILLLIAGIICFEQHLQHML